MNDDRYLRSIKDLEKVGSKWWPKEVREEAMNGLSPVSKWLLRTVFDNLRDALNSFFVISKSLTISFISAVFIFLVQPMPVKITPSIRSAHTFGLSLSTMGYCLKLIISFIEISLKSYSV